MDESEITTNGRHEDWMDTNEYASIMGRLDYNLFVQN
jgi:hypothetical protein